LNSDIKVSGAMASDKVRLQQLLEKLDLELGGLGKLGLGSNNLLFIACELLLLAEETEGLKLLLIEEPEAHLHTQRQLRMMRFLEKQAEENQIQVLVTTHSPNLASAISLSNLVMVLSGKAFSLDEGKTNLQSSDYRFLERFLDVTKANLFFARGVMIVEGDAENILLPTLARIMGRDFTEHGVSIVNVGGVGLRRYARIFQRQDPTAEGELDIPISCVTDMDVMPNCAPVIVGLIEEGATWPPTSGHGRRRWRAKKDFSESDLSALRTERREKASGQRVKTFVSDEWTLEYDLALGCKDDIGAFRTEIAEDVYIAARLAEKDDDINSNTVKRDDISAKATKEFAALKSGVVASGGCSIEEVLASRVYAKFVKKSIKAIAAQYLAEILWTKHEQGHLTSDSLRKSLPRYLVESIDYVTRAPEEANATSKSSNE
jgi:putative ATP-dependent endonuclease of OLD family